MNPADQAAIEQAKYNATQARTDAGNLMGSATENAGLFTIKAQEQLAQGVAILGKTGNLSDKTSAPVDSGISLGLKDSKETTDYRKQLADQMAAINATLATPETTTTSGGRGGDSTKVNYNKADLEAQLKIAQESLGALGPEGGGVADIALPDALLHATGSDLLTMVSTRDAMERDKRTLMRNAQSESIRALKAGENYDKMGEYAQQAADWNTWSTILGAGLSVAGMATGFGWNPFRKT